MFSPPARALPDSPTAMLQQRAEPSAGRLGAGRGQVDHRRQRRQQRVVGTLVAAQEAAHDPRAVAAAAELVHQRQGRRRPGEHRHVGLRPHARRARQHVGIALGEHDEVAFAQPRRLGADRVAPARAARDHVVLDDALRPGHHGAGDLPRRRRLGHPRRAQLEVEVHRAGQPHRAQHVREHVSRHADYLGYAGRASMPIRTRGQIRAASAGRTAYVNRTLAHGAGTRRHRKLTSEPAR